MLSVRPESRLAVAGADFRWAARELLQLQRERNRFFAPLNVAGPAWDLMLVLFAVSDDPEGLYLGEVAKRGAIPRTTALRWLRRLRRHGYVTLDTDQADRRAVLVNLTQAGEEAMQASFAAASSSPEPRDPIGRPLFAC
jgi:DNA-binding MarR family transcriptional regulator